MSRFVEENHTEKGNVSHVKSVVDKLSDGDEKTNDKESSETQSENHRRRKGLQEQLLNHRQYLYRERRKKMEKQNSSYRIRKDTREFYGKLASKKEASNKAAKETFKRELELFRERKEELENTTDEDDDDDDIEEDELEHIQTLSTEAKDCNLKKEESKPKSVKLVQYSESESESD